MVKWEVMARPKTFGGGAGLLTQEFMQYSVEKEVPKGKGIFNDNVTEHPYFGEGYRR
jgi:hypothetical protein